MKLVVDISRYQNPTAWQWATLGSILDGIIIRLSYGITEDRSASKHVANAKNVGLPFAGYHWVDPTWDMLGQIRKYTEVAEKHKPASMFNDSEQYWRDWTAFMAQDYAKAYATRFTPTQLNRYYKDFFDATRNLLTVGNYTGKWFMKAYSPQMAEWVVPNNFWNAHYVTTSRIFTPSNVRAYAETLDLEGAIGRQFSGGGLNVTGLQRLDWNIFSDAGFAKMFDHQVTIPEPPPVVVPPPPPVPTNLYKVNTYALYIRDVPNGRITGWKWKNEAVIVSEIVNGWAHLVQGGWMSVKYLVMVQ